MKLLSRIIGGAILLIGGLIMLIGNWLFEWGQVEYDVEDRSE